LRDADPTIPDALHDRAADNWRSLLAIADAAGGEWPEGARRAALKLGEAEEDADFGVQLLADVRAVFEALDTDRLASKVLIAELTQMSERPWLAFDRGKPITVRQLARLLKPFDVGSRQLRIEGQNVHGYSCEDFEDAFSRYLPAAGGYNPLRRYNPRQDWKVVTSDPLHSGTGAADEKHGKPLGANACSVVADENSGSGGVRHRDTCEDPGCTGCAPTVAS